MSNVVQSRSNMSMKQRRHLRNIIRKSLFLEIEQIELKPGKRLERGSSSKS